MNILLFGTVLTAELFIGHPHPGDGLPVAAFARTFANEKAVVQATWTTSGLGVYQGYVNGNSLKGFLKPGYTSPEKRRLSVREDVTAHLKTAAGATNVLGAIVTRGWFADSIVGWTFPHQPTGFGGVLELVYADGTRGEIVTDKSWQVAPVRGQNPVAPLLHADIFSGEKYDARVEAAWMTNGVTPKADGWVAAVPQGKYTGAVTPWKGPLIAVREDLEKAPREIWVYDGVTPASDTNCFGTVKVVRRPRDGEALPLKPGETMVVDFGENCASVPSFEVEGAAGAEIELHCAETLNDGDGDRRRGCDGPGGSPYRKNYRSAASQVLYTCGGRGVEKYRTEFTHFGYRYLSLTAKAPVVFRRLRSYPVSCLQAGDETGVVETGSQLVNRFMAGVRNTIRSNVMSVPTDCPQRDERLGWGMDAWVIAPTALLMGVPAGFYAKYVDDFMDDQREDGALRLNAPRGLYDQRYDNASWSDTPILLADFLWRFGDDRTLRDHYDGFRRFVDHVAATKYAIPADEKGITYGDWLSPDGYALSYGDPKKNANSPYIDYQSACYWLMDAEILADFARHLCKADDVAHWQEMQKTARAHIAARFVDPEDGLLDKSFRARETAKLYALRLKLLSPEALKKTEAELVAQIEKDGGHPCVGVQGCHFLLPTLTACGRADLAYTMFLKEDYPSWLFPFAKGGATAVWERWDGWRPEHGFQSCFMNSFCHCGFGSAAQWVYNDVLGIRPDPAAPGFRHFFLAPHPDRRLGFARTTLRTAAGDITSDWRYEGETWIWTFTVPAGATATVTVPGETTSAVYKAGTHRIERRAEEPLKVLMIGNSFSDPVVKSLPPVAQAMGRKLDIASAMIGGSSLEVHWKNYLCAQTNAAIRPYCYHRNTCGVWQGDKSIDEIGCRRFNLLEAVRDAKWDVITVHQASFLSMKEKTYRPWGDDLVAALRKLQPQAKILTQETWYYLPYDAKTLADGIADQQQKYRQITAAYADFARRNRLDGIIPSGTAVQLYRERLPVVYEGKDKATCGDPVGKDGVHLGPAGEYLQSLVWMATLFGVDITQCPYVSPAVTDPKVLSTMKDCAKAAVTATR